MVSIRHFVLVGRYFVKNSKFLLLNFKYLGKTNKKLSTKFFFFVVIQKEKINTQGSSKKN